MSKSSFREFAAEAVSERAKLDATGEGSPYLYYDGDNFYLLETSGIREFGWGCGDIREFDPGDYAVFYNNYEGEDKDEYDFDAIVDVWTGWLDEIANEYNEEN